MVPLPSSLSELLLYELKSSQLDLVPTLRKRASVWLEGAGFFEGAIRQAIAATDYERVGLLITRYWYGYVSAGQTATAQRWLESLPDETLTHDAPLALVKAWICALGGRREESARFLTLAESIPYEGPLPDGTAVEAGAAMLRASFGYDGVRSSVEAARRAAAGARANLATGCVALRAGIQPIPFWGPSAGSKAARGRSCPDRG